MTEGSAAAKASRHRVAQGDTLSKLARKSGCTVAKIQKANGLKTTVIYAGQTIELPDCSTRSSSKKPDRAARQSGSSSRDREPVAPSRDRGTSGTRKTLAIEHVVADGDTLGSIARTYNASLSDIRTWNKLKRDSVKLGQTLIVARTEQSARKPPPPVELPEMPLIDEMSAEEALEAADRAVDAMGEPGDVLTRPERVKDPYGDVTLAVRTDETDEEELAPSLDGRWTGGQSVGKPWDGSLSSPAKLVEGDGYYIRRPYRAYGTDHVVAQIKDVLERMHARFSDRHDLAVGDLSAEEGGKISEHHSHQTGRDLDIGFYFKTKPKGYPSGFVAAEKSTLDFKATWALLKAFLDTSRQPGGVQMIFLDYSVQKMIYEWAKDHEVPEDYLEWAFQYPRGKKASGGMVRHEPHHDDHLHIRFRCAPDDDGCE